MNAELLNLFVEKESRILPTRPWNQGGFKVASDARICVRIPCGEPDDTYESLGVTRIPKAMDLGDWQKFGCTQFVDWPFPQHCQEQCDKCNNTGIIVTGSDCKECNGEAEVECPHCGQDMKCDACNGTGGDRKESECDCRSQWKPLKCSYGEVAPKYVRLISMLPNVKWCDQTTDNGAVLFTFGDDGQGLICVRTC